MPASSCNLSAYAGAALTPLCFCCCFLTSKRCTVGNSSSSLCCACRRHAQQHWLQHAIPVCAVTMVFPEDYLMSRLFTPEIAAYYEKYYEGKGVTFIKGDTVTGELSGVLAASRHPLSGLQGRPLV